MYKGVPLQVKGLVNRPELNGLTGSIVSFNCETQRIVLELEGRVGEWP